MPSREELAIWLAGARGVHPLEPAECDYTNADALITWFAPPVVDTRDAPFQDLADDPVARLVGTIEYLQTIHHELQHQGQQALGRMKPSDCEAKSCKAANAVREWARAL